MTREFSSFSQNDTFDIAFHLADDAQPGLILAMDGDLGAGKTVFAKGYALGLGIEEPITSPTFTLIHEYTTGRLPFYHFDVYRLSGPEEMYTLGWEEYFFGGGVCLIEWARRIEELIPEDAIWIDILSDIKKGPDYRKIIIIEN